MDEFVCEIESGLSEVCCILGTESVFRLSGKTRRIKIINYFLVFHSYNSGYNKKVNSKITHLMCETKKTLITGPIAAHNNLADNNLARAG